MTESDVLGTTELGPVVDYWQCRVGPAPFPMHDWMYFGKKTQIYRCRRCSMRTSKALLKENTDGG